MRFLVYISLIFIFFSMDSYAQGREVTIFLNGSQKTGELLSVRDSVIALLKVTVENDEEILNHPEQIEIIHFSDIEMVRLEEIDVSGAGKGALIGGGIGLLTDIILFSIYKPKETVVFAATPLGTFSGTLIGWTVASIMSEDEKTVQPSTAHGVLTLREEARFPDNEPMYIRDIIDSLIKKDDVE